MDSLCFQAAGELAKKIGSGELTSLEVVQAHLQRIHRYQSKIHAIVTLCEKKALTAAQHADEQVKKGIPLGKLHGVPILIKDSFRVAGIRSTFGGLPQYLFYKPERDCLLVKRLRESGAIILGRTQLPLLALDWQSRTLFSREAKNPYDFKRTPGGSSGGAAAAIASGFAPLDLGSDLGGSTRYPSHCCGIYGFRPTDGLLPLHDIGPEDTPPAFEHLLSCGPMARNLADIRLMLEVLTQQESPPPRTLSQQKMRIAVSGDLLGLESDPETQAILQKWVQRLRAEGHEVREQCHPRINFAEAYRIHGIIAGHELSRVLPWFFKTKMGHFLFKTYLLRMKLGNGPFTKWISQGLLSSKEDYESALKCLEEIRRSTDEFFQEYDLWILPNSPGPAILRQRYGFSIPFQGRRIPYSEFLGNFQVPTATLGTPVLTLPVQRTDGLPMALQVHGPRFQDFELLHQAERHLNSLAQFSPPELK